MGVNVDDPSHASSLPVLLLARTIEIGRPKRQRFPRGAAAIAIRHRVGEDFDYRRRSRSRQSFGIPQMGSGLHQRRAAKAAKRKKLLAERRKAEPIAPRSATAQARRAGAAPIYRCLLQDRLFERGNGILLLARGTPDGGFVVGSFLLDTFCLGVKESFLHTDLDEREVGAMIAAMEESVSLHAVEPGYARNLVHEAVAYARSVGIAPHKDYGAVEALFGNVIADAGNAVFLFGIDGKPVYIPAEEDTPAQIRRRVDALRKKVGEDGFDVRLPEETEDAFLYDGLYDPDVPPDPQEWLDADENERLQAVRAYHRLAQNEDEEGFESEEKEEFHAGLHVAVENQLAADDPAAARRALERLLRAGLGRHEAVHAVASVLLEELVPSVRENRDMSRETYRTALDALTVESWRRATSAEEGED
jgi:hypothetical protein